jgi:hypothetical protein
LIRLDVATVFTSSQTASPPAQSIRLASSSPSSPTCAGEIEREASAGRVGPAVVVGLGIDSAFAAQVSVIAHRVPSVSSRTT